MAGLCMHPLTKEATHEKASSLSRTVSTWEPCSGELTGREGRCALPVLVTSLNLTHTMSKVRIRPDLLRQFGPAGDAAFVLVVTAELLPDVELEARTSYREQSLLVLPQAEPLESFIAASVPEPAHLLVIAPGRVVTSPRDIGRRKMLVVPCGSTPSSVASIAASIRAAEQTDPQAQDERASAFFDAVGDAERLEIADVLNGTSATFEHQDKPYGWNAQLGFVDWGEQQIVPSGEISVLPANIMTFEPEGRLALSGSLTFLGEPIVHDGPARAAAAAQEAAYRGISGLRSAPLAADVVDGEIRALRPLTPGAAAAAETLEALFAEDERYRILWELGVGLNESLAVTPENCATNEVYGGVGGRVHIGLGLTTATRFALTLPCNGSTLLASNGMLLAGEPPAPPRPRRLAVARNVRAGCGCNE